MMERRSGGEERTRVRGPKKAFVVVVGPLLLVMGLALAVVATGSHAAVSTQMTGYVDEEDDAIGLSFADGTPVGSAQMPGPVIPPGTYQVSINDLSQVGDFDLAGAGVSFATGVEQRVQVSWTVTFQPCALYSYRNDQQMYIYWFQTSASPGSVTACSGTLTGEATTTLATTTTTPVVTTKSNSLPPGEQVSAIGTVIPSDPIRGTIRAVTNRAGAITLAFAGRSVTTLEPGRYAISVDDKSAKAGLFVRKGQGRPLTVSGVDFVGKRSVDVDLSAGEWTYYAVAGGSAGAHGFTVASAS